MERKMTNRDKAEAYFMRLEGKSFQEIADCFGVSWQYIHHLLSGICERKPRRSLDTVVFPGIRNYMRENQLSFAGFSKILGISIKQVICGLCGKNDITKNFIDRVLDTTGMTYEQAFKKEGSEECTPTTTASSSASGPES